MVIVQVIFVLLFGGATATKEMTAYVFTNRNLHQISERFLSLTADPRELLDVLPIEESSFNMIRSLAPMFIRIGGVSTNGMVFGTNAPSGNWTMSGEQWSLLNELAKGCGAEVIVSLNAGQRIGSAWDSKNSMELISYSNAQPYEVGWQLGYSLETLRRVYAKDLGQDSVRLRMILNQFPFYKKAPLLSPDIRITQSSARSIREFLAEAGNSISAIPIQMSPAREEDINILQTGGLSPSELDQIMWGTRKPLIRHPVWIAESDGGLKNMSDALAWVMRLGAAAKAGYQVVMRKLDSDYLSAPHPDFWVSLIFKNLVGREVLDARIATGSKSLHVYSHCTPSARIDSALGQSGRYSKGAMTIFGVNKGFDAVKLNLRASLKDEPLHIYSITANEESDRIPMPTFLNGQELFISQTGEIPAISPRVKKHSRYPQVLIEPRSVFFIVYPESRLRTCISPNSPYPPDLTELTRKIRLETLDALEKEPQDNDYIDSEPSYVTFKSRASPPNERVPGVVKSGGDTTEKTAVPLVDKAVPASEKTEIPDDLDKKFDFLSQAIFGLKNLTKTVVRGKRDVELTRQKRNTSDMIEASCSETQVVTESPKPPMQTLLEYGIVSKDAEETPTTNSPIVNQPMEETTERRKPFQGLGLTLPPNPFGSLSLPEMPTLGVINEGDIHQRIEDLRSHLKEVQERLSSVLGASPDLASFPTNREEWESLIQNSPLLRFRRFSYLPDTSFEDTYRPPEKTISKRIDSFSPFFNPRFNHPMYSDYYNVPYGYHDYPYPSHDYPYPSHDYDDYYYSPMYRRKRSIEESDKDNEIPRTDTDNSVDSEEWFKDAERITRPPDETKKIDPQKSSKVHFISFIMERIKQLLKVFLSER